MSTRYALPASPGQMASTVCDGCGAVPLRAKATRRDLKRAFQQGPVKRFARGTLKLARVPSGGGTIIGRLCRGCRKEARRS